MIERPILFNRWMVRDLLEGRLKPLRRVIKPQPTETCSYERNGETFVGLILPNQPMQWGGELYWRYGAEWGTRPDTEQPFPICPYGVPGDLLWARETWGAVWPDLDHEYTLEQCNIEYRADLPIGCTDYPGEWPSEKARGNPDAPQWRASIHMPRWASRFNLTLTDVQAEQATEGTEGGVDDAGETYEAGDWLWVGKFEVQG